MRLVMMGTGPFAVPTFQWLLDSAHDVAALVTRPTPPGRRRSKTPVNPMRDIALQRGVDTQEPDDVNATDAMAALSALGAELLVVCDYGQILSAEALGSAKLGGVNLHASLLPKYRGAAPINWALYRGETETGVTVIHMSPKLDAGPALIQLQTPIEPLETAAELEPRLADLGISAVSQSIDLLANWDGQSALGATQDPALATRAPRLKKSDGLVDWNCDSQQIVNQVRAMKPWPGSFTYLIRSSGADPSRLILDRASVADDSANDGGERAAAGSLIQSSSDRLLIATGSGALSLERVQPAGKRTMEIAEFLRGYHLGQGDTFGSAEG